MANFQRTKYYAFAKLGAKQKSKRKYRRATGRHNKTRQKWRSRPPMVEVGYKNKANERGMINEKTPVLVCNVEDLKKIGKNNIALISKVGNKKKYEIAKECVAKKIEVFNFNVNKIIKQTEKKFNKNGKKMETKNAESK